jgi:hypothetical protein
MGSSATGKKILGICYPVIWTSMNDLSYFFSILLILLVSYVEGMTYLLNYTIRNWRSRLKIENKPFQRALNTK